MNKNLTEKEIKELVMETLTSPANLIMMLLKYGKRAAYRIDHGQLHLDAGLFLCFCFRQPDERQGYPRFKDCRSRTNG